MVICAHIFQIGLNILKNNYEKIEENDGDIDDEHDINWSEKFT